MEEQDLSVEVVVLAGRSSGDQAVAMLADAGQGDRPAELWRGTRSGRHVLFIDPPRKGHLPRDRRWSAAPPSPFDTEDRLEFLGDVTARPVAEASDWVEVVRTTLSLQQVRIMLPDAAD